MNTMTFASTVILYREKDNFSLMFLLTRCRNPDYAMYRNSTQKIVLICCLFVCPQETVRTSSGKVSSTRVEDVDLDQCWDERLLRKLVSANHYDFTHTNYVICLFLRARLQDNQFYFVY